MFSSDIDIACGVVIYFYPNKKLSKGNRNEYYTKSGL